MSNIKSIYFKLLSKLRDLYSVKYVKPDVEYSIINKNPLNGNFNANNKYISYKKLQMRNARNKNNIKKKDNNK